MKHRAMIINGSYSFRDVCRYSTFSVYGFLVDHCLVDIKAMRAVSCYTFPVFTRSSCLYICFDVFLSAFFHKLWYAIGFSKFFI